MLLKNKSCPSQNHFGSKINNPDFNKFSQFVSKSAAHSNSTKGKKMTEEEKSAKFLSSLHKEYPLAEIDNSKYINFLITKAYERNYYTAIEGILRVNSGRDNATMK